MPTPIVNRLQLLILKRDLHGRMGPDWDKQRTYVSNWILQRLIATREQRTGVEENTAQFPINTDIDGLRV